MVKDACRWNGVKDLHFIPKSPLRSQGPLRMGYIQVINRCSFHTLHDFIMFVDGDWAITHVTWLLVRVIIVNSDFN